MLSDEGNPKSSRRAAQSEKCIAKVSFRGSALSRFSQLRRSHPVIQIIRLEGPKPQFVTRGSHAGARAQSKALRQNLLGSVARRGPFAVCRCRRIAHRPPTEPANRRRKSARDHAFASRGAGIVTDWSRSPARLLEATRRAPRAALRRRRRGRNTKSGAPAPRGFESGTRF